MQAFTRTLSVPLWIILVTVKRRMSSSLPSPKESFPRGGQKKDHLRPSLSTGRPLEESQLLGHAHHKIGSI